MLESLWVIVGVVTGVIVAPEIVIIIEAIIIHHCEFIVVLLFNH